MAPEHVAFLRSWMRLTDHIVDDNDERFKCLAAVIAWSEKQRKSQGKDREADSLVVDAYNGEPGLMLALLNYLATLHPSFFLLLRRMAANDLIRRKPTEALRQVAAVLLVAEPPQTKRHALAKHLVAVLALCIGHRIGWLPTESSEKKGRGTSGSAKLVQLLKLHGLSVEYNVIEGAWKRRHEVLEQAGFSKSEVDEFFVSSEILTKNLQ